MFTPAPTSSFPQFFSSLTPTDPSSFGFQQQNAFGSSDPFGSTSLAFGSTPSMFSPFQPQSASPFFLQQPQQPQQPQSMHQPSLAHENSKVSTMNLKDKKQRLLTRCLKQVKDNRTNVLQRLREGSLTPHEIKSNLHQLIVAEHSQESMSMDSSNKLAQLEELEGEEYQQIMTFLEEALFEGLRQEERQLLEEYYEEFRKCEEEMEKEDLASLEHALESHFDDEGTFVLCPVCKKNKLLENHHIIFCACGMRIDTKQDDVDLTYLRARLCELFQLHSAQCDGELKFSCNEARFGVPAMLFMNCTQCPCNEIVL